MTGLHDGRALGKEVTDLRFLFEVELTELADQLDIRNEGSGRGQEGSWM